MRALFFPLLFLFFFSFSTKNFNANTIKCKALLRHRDFYFFTLINELPASAVVQS